MADIYLIWYSFDDHAITAPRNSVMRWAQDLGVPSGPMTKHSSAGAFTKIAASATVSYTDARGKDQLLSGREVRRTDEFITFDIVNEQGMRLGQMKLFSARRTRDGIVPNTAVTRYVVRKSLPDEEYQAVHTWIAAVNDLLEAERGSVPWYQLRRLMKAATQMQAVPILRRASTFFCYTFQLDHIHKVQEFAFKASAGASFEILPIETSADYTVFTESADAFLAERAQAVSEAITSWEDADPRRRRGLRTSLGVWGPERDEVEEELRRHEGRLNRALPQAHSALDALTDRIRAVHPSGLPRVTT